MNIIYFICLFVTFITKSKCGFNESTSIICRGNMKTDDKKVNSLCGVVVSYVRCGVENVYTSRPNATEINLFETDFLAIEGNPPCKYSLRDIVDDIWNKSNIDKSVFDWDREAKCREKIQKYVDDDFDLQDVCPDLIEYSTCVIQTAFLRRPTSDELKKAMDEFKAKAGDKKIPECVDKAKLEEITKNVWVLPTNDVLKDSQGIFFPNKEKECRDKFWKDFKKSKLNEADSLLLLYMKCTAETGFFSKPSAEGLDALEDTLVQPTATIGRQLAVTYDLQKMADESWGGANVLRASVLLCVSTFIFMKLVL